MSSGPLLDHEALRHLQTVIVLAFVAAVTLGTIGVLAVLSSYPVGAPWLLAGSTALVLGVGLMRRSRVARRAACLWSALWIPFFPVGTAFGLYALWVLASRRVAPFFGGQAPTAKAKPFGAILAAQVSLAGCAAWAFVVLTQLAWPMLAEAHQAQRLEPIAGTEQHP